MADHFEKEDPAMHKTNTVDYAKHRVIPIYGPSLGCLTRKEESARFHFAIATRRFDVTVDCTQIANSGALEGERSGAEPDGFGRP
jgi:hypothetical protein